MHIVSALTYVHHFSRLSRRVARQLLCDSSSPPAGAFTCAGTRWRDQMVGDLRKVMKLNRHNSLLKSGRVKQSMLAHRVLVEALTARDAATGMRRMQQHSRTGLRLRRKGQATKQAWE